MTRNAEIWSRERAGRGKRSGGRVIYYDTGEEVPGIVVRERTLPDGGGMGGWAEQSNAYGAEIDVSYSAGSFAGSKVTVKYL